MGRTLVGLTSCNTPPQALTAKPSALLFFSPDTDELKVDALFFCVLMTVKCHMKIFLDFALFFGQCQQHQQLKLFFLAKNFERIFANICPNMLIFSASDKSET